MIDDCTRSVFLRTVSLDVTLRSRSESPSGIFIFTLEMFSYYFNYFFLYDRMELCVIAIFHVGYINNIYTFK